MHQKLKLSLPKLRRYREMAQENWHPNGLGRLLLLNV